MIVFFNPKFWRAVVAPATLRRGIKVAAIVGVILNLINQWDAVMGRQAFHVIQGLLTFCVPFCVSVYSAASFAVDTGEPPPQKTLDL